MARNISKPDYDRDTYMVRCRHAGGDYYPEINHDDAISREAIKRHIREWQFDDIDCVIRFTLAEGSCCDVSEDLAREINKDLINAGKYAFPLLAAWIEAKTNEDAYREREAA